jgi:membrane-associated HD superfamily phosphohydrolase
MILTSLKNLLIMIVFAFLMIATGFYDSKIKKKIKEAKEINFLILSIIGYLLVVIGFLGAGGFFNYSSFIVFC